MLSVPASLASAPCAPIIINVGMMRPSRLTKHCLLIQSRHLKLSDCRSSNRQWTMKQYYSQVL